MHCSVWLEVLLDEELIFFKHECNVRVCSIRIVVDLVEISAYRILFVVELLKVNSLGAVNVVCDQSTKNTFVLARDPLLLCERVGILDRIRKNVIDLLETKVLAVVVRFRHFF